MKRVKMIVAYDGTNYCGWQIQNNGITIEEILNRELTNLLKETVTVIGASRTDSGVHSEGNVAVFDTENRMPADKICFALNQRLPDDIRILQSEEVAPDYHPRKQNCVKTYEYKIMNRKIEVPTMSFTAISAIFPWMWSGCGKAGPIWWENMILKASVRPVGRRKRPYVPFIAWTLKRPGISLQSALRAAVSCITW